jgi:hypothetical protein
VEDTGIGSKFAVNVEIAGLVLVVPKERESSEITMVQSRRHRERERVLFEVKGSSKEQEELQNIDPTYTRCCRAIIADPHIRQTFAVPFGPTNFSAIQQSLSRQTNFPKRSSEKYFQHWSRFFAFATIVWCFSCLASEWSGVSHECYP